MTTTEAPSCSRCGSPMVRATAKSGPRIGQPLWRCSDFLCPTLINIDESDATPPVPVAGESAQARFERERLARTERVRRLAPFLASVAVLLAAGAFFVVLELVGDLRIAAFAGMVVIGVTLWLVIRLPPDVLRETPPFCRQSGTEAPRGVGRVRPVPSNFHVAADSPECTL